MAKETKNKRIYNWVRKLSYADMKNDYFSSLTKREHKKIKFINEKSAEVKFKNEYTLIDFVDMVTGLEAIHGIIRNNGLFNIPDDLKTNCKVYFDVGANDGSTSIWGHYNLLNAEIYSIEPNPFAIKVMKRNLLRVVGNKINIIEKAASTDGGKIVNLSFDDNLSLMATIKKEWTDNKKNNIKVQTVNLSDLIKDKCDNVNPNDVLLKMDIEGGEISLFNDPYFLETISKYVGNLIIETHGSITEQEKIIREVTKIFPLTSSINTTWLDHKGIPQYFKEFGKRVEVDNFDWTNEDIW